MKALRISPDLALPASFATEGVAVIGMRGSGKSNTMVRWVEVLYDAGIPWVAIDPKGDYWGIRSSADGKSAGLSVPVFGGRYQDFPLTEHMGADIANLLVEENFSAVLDVSTLSHAARARFLIAFCNQLMDRHKAEPHARCVILEEAHRYIPQQTQGGGDIGKLKEAASSLLLEGRSFGLGCWAVTQRPARLHKDVLEEVGTVILHRIGAAATNDLKTIAGWVKHEDLGEEIVPSLNKLKAGEAWVLAPATLGIAQRIQVDRRTTFDSGATPLVGAGSRPAVTLADIDSAAIKEQLAEAVEKAKESDPRHLQAQVRALRTEVEWWHHFVTKLGPDSTLPKVGSPLLGNRWRLRPDPDPDAAPDLVEVEVHSLPPGLVARAEALLEGFHGPMAALGTFIETLDRAEERPPAPITPQRIPTPEQTAERRSARSPAPRRAEPEVSITTSAAGEVRLERMDWALLGVLVQRPKGLTRDQVALFAGYSPSSGAIDKALARLRRLDWITKGGARITATPAGQGNARAADPLPSGSDLLAALCSDAGLPNGFRMERMDRAFLALVAANPGGLTRDDVAESAGYAATSGAVDKALARLRRIGFVAKGQPLTLTEEFAEATAS